MLPAVNRCRFYQVTKRVMMAAVAARLADLSILTAEDPRTESLAGILEEMARSAHSQGGIEGKTFVRIQDRGAAIRVDSARNGRNLSVIGRVPWLALRSEPHPHPCPPARRARSRQNLRFWAATHSPP